MNWTKLAEDRIEEAIANGEFDNLPGEGQPLNLAEYFALPAAERAGAALLKNAHVLPAELQLLKEIAEMEETILIANGAEKRRRLREQLQEKRVSFALATERRRRGDARPLN